MTQRLPPADLAPYTDRADLSLDELVDAAESLLLAVAPVQQRYKVTAKPDVRTIRYYTSQGLLPKPLSYDGGRARYGLVHLLRLLFIKKRQAEHHTLKRIKTELAETTDADLRAELVDVERVAEPAIAEPTVVDDTNPTPDSKHWQARQTLTLSLPADNGVDGAPRTMASLNVEAAVLSDPQQRERLAQHLEVLAAQLRAGEQA